MNNTNFHKPVMRNEAVEHLLTNKDGIYVDATLGYGGHTKLILKKHRISLDYMQLIRILMQLNITKKNYLMRRDLPLNMDVSLH